MSKKEPKGIVFISKLLLLFQFCHFCTAKNPDVVTQQTGTMTIIKSKCHNCSRTYTWHSQPLLFRKFPAGNILLSYAILSAGASVKKVLLVFKHLGLMVYHEPAYYYHQKHLLFPAIYKYWQAYQKKLLDSLKDKDVVLAGDGRHDSMGHSAKYGAYTIFCCTVGLIVHLVIIQVQTFRM